MITENIRRILGELPENVFLEAAAKKRQPSEVLEAIDAGIGIIGENYVQEAEAAIAVVGQKAKWHFIGHLQKNKVKKAVVLFDLIETVDSAELATEIDCHCAPLGKVMPVLVEINSGREAQKSGVLPEEAVNLIRQISKLAHIRVAGLMTMGPYTSEPEELRPHFAATKRLFEEIKTLNLSGVEMKYLSMGMSDSYKVAIAEGANIVRIGSGIFGPR